MSKGVTEPLRLKKELINTKEMLTNKLLGRTSNQLTLGERRVYNEWLSNIRTLIAICDERKRF